MSRDDPQAKLTTEELIANLAGELVKRDDEIARLVDVQMYDRALIKALTTDNARLQRHAKSMIDALNADIDAKAAEIAALRAG
jgi:isocitrate dehydrogenase kinase/phosphatase